MMDAHEAQAAHNEKTTRQVLYHALEDMDIDGTSPLGLYVIENYRVPIHCMGDFVAMQKPSAIQRFIDEAYLGNVHIEGDER